MSGYYGKFSYSYLYDILGEPDTMSLGYGVHYHYSKSKGWWFTLKLTGDADGTVVRRAADGTSIGATNKSSHPTEWTFEECQKRAFYWWTKLYNKHWREEWNTAPLPSDPVDPPRPTPRAAIAERAASRRPLNRPVVPASLSFVDGSDLDLDDGYDEPTYALEELQGSSDRGRENNFAKSLDTSTKRYYCVECQTEIYKRHNKGRPPVRCVAHGGKQSI